MQNLHSQYITRISPAAFLLATAALLSGCGSEEAVTGTPPPVSAPTTSTVATLSLSANPITVKSDNTDSTTVTLAALTTGNVAVPNTTVTVSVDTGSLTGVSGAGTVTTSATGEATFTFKSGTASKANRTATITATSGSATTQLPVQIIGSTLTPDVSATMLTNITASTTITFTARDAGNNLLVGETITLAESGTGDVTLSTTSGVTDINGRLAVTVTGVTTGVRVITASGVGATAAVNVTVPAGATTTFAISQATLNGSTSVFNPTAVAMQTSDSLLITVTAPLPTTQVLFVTSQGLVNGANFVVVPVANGLAAATLTTTVAGIAGIEVTDFDNPTLSDVLTVSMTAVTPASISLQATPTVIPKKIGSTTGVSTLIATVNDANGQPVGGVPVAFSMFNTTGGGETLTRVIAYTASTPTATLGLGQAATAFNSGSLPSGAGGVKIRAAVPGTTVTTTPSTDAAIVIGGTAGSIAFGQATVVAEGGNGTTYVYDMSVVVADVNGNPVPPGTPVNLSVWPIAWSTGTNCTPALTLLNEDVNEDLILGSGEDGLRIDLSDTNLGAGVQDNQLTPPNSAGGTLPATVTTDASGVATFKLTYSKASAIWIVDRIRASASVQGTEAVGEIQFRLPALASDVGTDVASCKLPPSPYFL